MKLQPLVLAVDDELPVLRLMRMELTEQGFRVVTASSGEEAMRMAEQHRPDIALLDVMMPEVSGFEVMRDFRERWDTPIILVTARDRHHDRVRGLELGADDYIVKPFHPEELGARIRSVLRRSIGRNVDRTVKCGDLEVDLLRRRVRRGEQELQLTRTEWRLLEQLAANSGKVLLPAELLARVWGPEYRDEFQYLRVWISRLRQKLSDSEGHAIKTLPGIGYVFQADEEPSIAPQNGGTGEPAAASVG